MSNVADLFSRMPAAFKSDKAAGLNATVLFDLSGPDGGQWAVTVANGACTVNQGAAEKPTATVRMTASDYADMMSGRLNPINAFMMGKVKVEGDLNTVMKFQTLFG
ncbi:MAG: SCP2 sterol-binding domain-containing protein [Chloroflexota bacterium]